MNISQAILSTLAYHDIFDYPLRAEEIHTYLIGKKSDIKSILSSLIILELSGRILKQGSLYALKGRKKLFTIRTQRQKYSKSKLNRAYFYATLLTLIPTIKTIAVSGALAMQNSHKSDDIDFLIITSKNTLWTTRFFANLILFPFKRKPQLSSSHYSLASNNRACLNLFLDEQDLKIKEQNLYTAHELAQLKILYDKQKTYSRVIRSNNWLLKFLPNWKMYKLENGKWKMENLSLLEILLKKFQLAYMKSKISTERIGDHQLFFHPANTQDWVLREYKKRVRE
ncbi:MAG TPA: hypothetical protein VLE91_02075 [Candidatus Saccharimonadales bacterium]|nr:hypothetical protein [Candidatus Saccharimonadales bacterium]